MKQHSYRENSLTFKSLDAIWFWFNSFFKLSPHPCLSKTSLFLPGSAFALGTRLEWLPTCFPFTWQIDLYFNFISFTCSIHLFTSSSNTFSSLFSCSFLSIIFCLYSWFILYCSYSCLSCFWIDYNSCFSYKLHMYSWSAYCLRYWIDIHWLGLLVSKADCLPATFWVDESRCNVCDLAMWPNTCLLPFDSLLLDEARLPFFISLLVNDDTVSIVLTLFMKNNENYWSISAFSLSLCPFSLSMASINSCLVFRCSRSSFLIDSSLLLCWIASFSSDPIINWIISFGSKNSSFSVMCLLLSSTHKLSLFAYEFVWWLEGCKNDGLVLVFLLLICLILLSEAYPLFCMPMSSESLLALFLGLHKAEYQEFLKVFPRRELL